MKQILASVGIVKESSMNSWFKTSLNNLKSSSLKVEEGATMAYSFTDDGVDIFHSWSPRKWHSACFVFKNQNMTMYIDGKEIARKKFKVVYKVKLLLFMFIFIILV